MSSANVIEIFVTFIESEGPLLKVWGQVDRSSAIFVERLILKYSEQFERGVGIPNFSSLYIGQLCCAKYGGDGLYYRAIISSLDNILNGEIEVKFIDYGNTESVTINNIRALNAVHNSPLNTVPAQAEQFYLAGVVPTMGEWDLIGLMYIRRKLCYVELKGIVVSNVLNRKLLIILYENLDFSQLLIDGKLGISIGINAQEVLLEGLFGNGSGHSPDYTVPPPRHISIQGDNVPDRPPVRNGNLMPREIVQSQPPRVFTIPILDVDSEHDVRVSYVEDGPTTFAVHLHVTEEHLNRLTMALNELTPRPVTEPLLPGSVCLGRCSSDKLLCRAVVMKVMEVECKLYFVDYGNSEVVSYSDIYELPPQYCLPKGLALRFTLAGSRDVVFDEEGKNIFKDIVSRKLLRLRVVPSEGPPIKQYGELYLRGQNVLHILLQRIQSVRIMHCYPRLTPPKIGVVVEATVSYVVTVTNFFVHLEDNSEELSTIMACVESYCNGMAPNVTINQLCMGMPVCALYSADQKWYRAKVMSVAADSVSVLYVDYGNTDILPISSLKQIESNLSKIHAQALACCLNGYQDLENGEVESAKLEEVTFDKVLSMKVVEYLPNGMLLVELIDKNVAPPVDIGAQILLFSESSLLTLTETETDDWQDSSTSHETTDFIMSSKERMYSHGRDSSKSGDSGGDTRRQRAAVGTNWQPERDGKWKANSRDAYWYEHDDRLKSDKKWGSHEQDDTDDRKWGTPEVITDNDKWESHENRSNKKWGGRENKEGNSRKWNEHDVTSRGDKKWGGHGMNERGDKKWGGHEERVGSSRKWARNSDGDANKWGDHEERVGNNRKWGGREERVGNGRKWDGREEKIGGDRKWSGLEEKDRSSGKWGGRSDEDGHQSKPWKDSGNKDLNKKIVPIRSKWSRKDDSEDMSHYSGGSRASKENKPWTSSSVDNSLSWIRTEKDAVQGFPEAVIPLGSTEDVELVFATNPSDFVVQISNNSAQLADIMERIASEYDSDKGLCRVVSSPKVGTACIARYADDGTWYRALVENVGDSVEVQFVDYGNKDNVPLIDVKEILPEFLNIPTLGVQCNLMCAQTSGNEWTNVMVSAFMDLTDGKPLRAHFVQRKGRTVEVVLKEVVGGIEESVSINEKFGATCDELKAAIAASKYIFSPKRIPSFASITDRYAELCMDSKMKMKVEVSWFINPEQFYCRFKSSASSSQFVDMVNNIQLANKGRRPLNRPFPVGTPIIAKFPDDNVLYRAEIKEEGGQQSCMVQYVDYGNCERLDISNLWQIESQFMVLPRQAMLCSLHGVKPVDSMWPINSADFSNFFGAEELDCVFHGCVSDKNCVSLYQDELCIGRKLVECGLAAEVVDDSNAKKEIAEEHYNWEMLQGQQLSASVSYIESISKFFVQLEPAYAKELHVKVQEFADKQPLEAIVGEKMIGLCCLATPDGTRWHRGKILDAPSTTHVLVNFVDVGDGDLILHSNVRTIPAELSWPRFQATECFVSGAADKSPPADLEEHFKMEVEDQDVILIVDAAEDGRLSVRLFDVEGQRLELLKTIGNASTLEIDPVCPMPILTSTAHVWISHVDGPCALWLQRVCDGDLLAQLLDDLYIFYQTEANGQVAPVQVGKTYAVLSVSDSGWYRGRVTSVTNEDASVCFIDYGNSEVIPLIHVKELDPSFFSPHALAFCTSLAVVAKDKEKCTEVLTEMVTDRDFNVSFTRTVSGEWLVDTGESMNLAKKLIESGLAINLYPGCSSAANPEDISLPKVGPPSTVAVSEHEDCTTLEGSLTVVISHVNSPADFWVQCESFSSQLDEIADKLSSAENFEPFPEAVDGELCAALFPEDEQWYRAKILSCREQDIEVIFIDYGNSSSSTDLQSLPSELLQIPPLAKHCCLLLPEAWTEWPIVAGEEFMQIFGDGSKVFELSVLQEGDPAVVSLSYEGLKVENRLERKCLHDVNGQEAAAITTSFSPLETKVICIEGTNLEDRPDVEEHTTVEYVAAHETNLKEWLSPNKDNVTATVEITDDVASATPENQMEHNVRSAKAREFRPEKENVPAHTEITDVKYATGEDEMENNMGGVEQLNVERENIPADMEITDVEFATVGDGMEHNLQTTGVNGMENMRSAEQLRNSESENIPANMEMINGEEAVKVENVIQLEAHIKDISCIPSVGSLEEVDIVVDEAVGSVNTQSSQELHTCEQVVYTSLLKTDVVIESECSPDDICLEHQFCKTEQEADISEHIRLMSAKNMSSQECEPCEKICKTEKTEGFEEAPSSDILPNTQQTSSISHDIKDVAITSSGEVSQDRTFKVEHSEKIVKNLYVELKTPNSDIIPRPVVTENTVAMSASMGTSQIAVAECLENTPSTPNGLNSSNKYTYSQYTSDPISAVTDAEIVLPDSLSQVASQGDGNVELAHSVFHSSEKISGSGASGGGLEGAAGNESITQN